MHDKLKTHTSFKEIYESYSALVYNLCLNYLQNEEDAKNATQEIFVKIYQKQSKFKGKSNPQNKDVILIRSINFK